MEIFYLLAELITFLLIGYVIGRFKENLSKTISLHLINFGIPISLMGILLKSGLTWRLIHSAAMALVAISFLMTILNYFPIFKKYIPNRTLQLGSAFGNTGYFGIPVSLALLPKHALVYSIGFDLGATLVIWSLEPKLLKVSSKEQRRNKYWKNLMNAVSNSPAFKGLIAALLIKSSPWNEQITFILWIPSRIVLVLALVIICMRLSWLRKSNLSKNQIPNFIYKKRINHKDDWITNSFVDYFLNNQITKHHEKCFGSSSSCSHSDISFITISSQFKR